MESLESFWIPTQGATSYGAGRTRRGWMDGNLWFFRFKHWNFLRFVTQKGYNWYNLRLQSNILYSIAIKVGRPDSLNSCRSRGSRHSWAISSLNSFIWVGTEAAAMMCDAASSSFMAQSDSPVCRGKPAWIAVVFSWAEQLVCSFCLQESKRLPLALAHQEHEDVESLQSHSTFHDFVPRQDCFAFWMILHCFFLTLAHKMTTQRPMMNVAPETPLRGRQMPMDDGETPPPVCPFWTQAVDELNWLVVRVVRQGWQNMS